MTLMNDVCSLELTPYYMYFNIEIITKNFIFQDQEICLQRRTSTKKKMKENKTSRNIILSSCKLK